MCDPGLFRNVAWMVTQRQMQTARQMERLLLDSTVFTTGSRSRPAQRASPQIEPDN